MTFETEDGIRDDMIVLMTCVFGTFVQVDSMTY